MPYNASTAPSSLSFRPATYNIAWDGVSKAQATFELACFSTAATYSAFAYPVFASKSTVACGTGTNAVVYTQFKGERVFTLGTACQILSKGNVQLPITAANSTAAILFSAVTSNLEYSHAWQLVATKSSGTQVLIGGRIDIQTFDPYERSRPTEAPATFVEINGCL